MLGPSADRQMHQLLGEDGSPASAISSVTPVSRAITVTWSFQIIMTMVAMRKVPGLAFSDTSYYPLAHAPPIVGAVCAAAVAAYELVEKRGSKQYCYSCCNRYGSGYYCAPAQYSTCACESTSI